MSAALVRNGADEIQAALIASQLLGYAFARYVVQLPPIRDLDRHAAVAWLAPALQRYLDAAPPEPGAPADRGD